MYLLWKNFNSSYYSTYTTGTKQLETPYLKQKKKLVRDLETNPFKGHCQFLTFEKVTQF